MLTYLTRTDFASTITPEDLDVLSAGDPSPLEAAEAWALARTRHELGRRYDLTAALAPHSLYDPAKPYPIGTRVTDDDGRLWEAIAPIAAGQSPSPFGLDGNGWTRRDSRDRGLVGAIVSLALYRLHGRLSPAPTPEARLSEYAAAMAWLREAGTGRIEAGLPRRAARPGHLEETGAQPLSGSMTPPRPVTGWL